MNSKNQSQIKLYIELFTTYKWNLFVGVFLCIQQQLCGISLVNYYGPKILRDAGFAATSRESLMLSMTFIMAFNFTGNLACTILSKRFGRRELILKCAFPITIALLVLDSMIISNEVFG